MNLVKLEEIFSIEYGNGFALSNMEIGNIPFVARGSNNNGVSGYVGIVDGQLPFDSGKLTVAVSGSVLETFLQEKKFYTAYHVMVLSPLIKMNTKEKLVYCSLIRANKFRYNYGRQANKTLKNLMLPNLQEVKKICEGIQVPSPPSLEAVFPKKRFRGLELGRVEGYFKVEDLFEITYGNQFDLNKMTLAQKGKGIAFVSRTSKNNGVSAWVEQEDVKPFNTGSITVSMGGTYLLSSFVQRQPFYTSQNVKVLIPKSNLTLEERIFYTVLIRHNRFRYTSHGREANKTFDLLTLPAFNTEYVTQYMKALPSSSNLL